MEDPLWELLIPRQFLFFLANCIFMNYLGINSENELSLWKRDEA
jgi:hypothetical protein